jgi:hypothetical protein
MLWRSLESCLDRAAHVPTELSRLHYDANQSGVGPSQLPCPVRDTANVDIKRGVQDLH